MISLALILKNPAPRAPAPCTSVLKLDPEPDRSGQHSFWDPGLHKRTSDESEKRGAIISHGTLVVVRLLQGNLFHHSNRPRGVVQSVTCRTVDLGG